MQSHLYRIMDANLNRTREGLRVAEEIARLVLESAGLQKRFKAVRHGVISAEQKLPQAELVKARAAYRDPGARHTSQGEKKRSQLHELVRANLRRSQEGLRVLEETAKLLAPLASPLFKRLRFKTYDLEVELLNALQRATQAKAKAHFVKKQKK